MINVCNNATKEKNELQKYLNNGSNLESIWTLKVFNLKTFKLKYIF